MPVGTLCALGTLLEEEMETPPTCPECNKPMASRNGKYGQFWGCSQYPSCRGIRNIKGTAKLPSQPQVRVESKSHAFTGPYNPSECCPFDDIPGVNDVRTAFGMCGHLTSIDVDVLPELDSEYLAVIRGW